MCIWEVSSLGLFGIAGPYTFLFVFLLAQGLMFLMSVDQGVQLIAGSEDITCSL